MGYYESWSGGDFELFSWRVTWNKTISALCWARRDDSHGTGLGAYARCGFLLLGRIFPIGFCRRELSWIKHRIWRSKSLARATPSGNGRKRREYFAGGTRLVWQVYPATRRVRVYTTVDAFVELTEDDTLEGDPVLPGFTLSVRRWFERAGQS